MSGEESKTQQFLSSQQLTLGI